jgi:hypothetical protein
MTRLVSRKSTSPSSSQAGSVSPVSHPASPHNNNPRDSNSYHSHHHHTQQQAHIPIQSSWPTFTQSNTPDMGIFQPHQYLVQHDAHYQFGEMRHSVPQSAPFDIIPGFYGYPSPTGALNGSVQMMTVDNGMPGPDVTTSWHNFMAQYNK